jgi:hypothetical protein
MNDTPLNRTDPELLISRIVDGEATPRDWSEFRLQAEREASLWRDLAEAQRMQGDLGDEVAAALSVVNQVDVPVHTEMVRRLSGRIRMVGMWGGWLAAACVGLMWANGERAGMEQNGPSQAGMANLTPARALQEYLNKGQTEGKVIGELPEKVLVQARPMTEGNGLDITGYEVVYVRQILERTTVKDLYRFGKDEAGDLRPIPVQIRPGRPN